MSRLIDFARVLENMKAHSMPSAHRLVMLLMAQHANEHDLAWPSLLLLRDETGYGRTKLAQVIGELVAAGWLVPAGNVGEGLRRAARYEVRTDGRAWPEDSRTTRERPPPPAPVSRAAGGLCPADPYGGTLVSRAADLSRPADLPPVSRAAGTNLPVTHQINPPDQPPIALAREHARGDLPQQAVLFGPLADAPATSTPIPASTVKAKKAPPPPPKPPRARPAAELYLEAFVAGLGDAGHVITAPRGTDGALLGRIAAAHARTGAGPIVGEALLVWIRERAAAFRRALSRPELHRGGVSVYGFQTWLDNGAQKQPGPLGADAEEWTEPEEDPPRVPFRPERMDLGARIAAMQEADRRWDEAHPPMPPEELAMLEAAQERGRARMAAANG